MIDQEILDRLVPEGFPEESQPRGLPKSIDPESPGRRIGMWAYALRRRIYEHVEKEGSIRQMIGGSGFVGTGIFYTPNVPSARDYDGFPIVEGYQFGAVLFRGNRLEDGAYVADVPMDFGRYNAPMIQTIATFNEHARYSPDGYAAATFHNDDGDECGITARHIVSKYRVGQRVPVECSDCGDRARLARKGPGLIDAATIVYPCGGPGNSFSNRQATVRSAVEGETVKAHFGDSGKQGCTVMQSLSSPTQILSAAAPQHFLTDKHGQPGDSGSLISGLDDYGSPDLIGMYLGDTQCEDENRNYVTYGYSLDLRQAANLLGASGLSGEFNV